MDIYIFIRMIILKTWLNSLEVHSAAGREMAG